MARRFSIHSHRSHVLVAVLTAVFILSLQNFTDVLIVYSTNKSESGSKKVLAHTGGLTNQHALTPTDQATPASRAAKRIDLSSCPDQRLVVAAKAKSWIAGIGHRTMQNFYVFWHAAMMKGYCYCFDTENFGYGLELYHLLLEPVFPSCNARFPNRTLKTTRFNYLKRQDISKLATDNKIIQWIEAGGSEIWPSEEQKRRSPGHGDLLAFIDSFLRDNHLLEHAIIPWYQQHKSIATAFRTTTKAGDINATTVETETHDNLVPYDDGAKHALNAVFHLRVGDIVLKASESYWRNVLNALMDIVELEVGSNHTVNIYWAYFQADHRGSIGDTMRAMVAQNVVGEWPSEPGMLPRSHKFLAKLYEDFKSIK
ncbi:hypothetical protein MHU86_8783 [Fragilaria crotonensis]|nr:hypothetical protein MHU86_8783 [Fragilaria crotonensis]